MQKFQTINDHRKEKLLYKQRALSALVVVISFLLILLFRLIYLQVILHNQYQTQSDNNRVSVKPIPPTRGLIFDRNGELLADNIPSFGLELIPEQTQDIEGTIKALSKIISITEDDQKFFYRELKRKRRFEGIPIRLKLSQEELAQFAVNRHLFPAVEIRAGLIRHYPEGELTAHILGYVGRISDNELQALDTQNYSATQYIGKIGLEKYYENVLHGTVGDQQVETNAIRRVVRTLKNNPPVAGQNLTLGLDLELQRVAMKALENKRGVAIVLSPQDGAILALASQPSYDTNLFVVGLNNKTYHALQTAEDNPLFNRAIRGQYPPGSTIKPFLALQALDHKAISPTEKIYDPGWYQLKNDTHKYRDWRRAGHGWITLARALRESCSTFFYHLAHKMGIDDIHAILTQFGFGQLTGVDIATEVKGLAPSREWKRRVHQQPWYPGETLISGIGQGYTLVTPIQLAKATAMLANQGTSVHPHLLIDPLEMVKQGQENSVTLENDWVWQYVKNAMTDVTQNPHGTAFRSFHSAPYKVAGKTGTAQVSNIKQGESYDEKQIPKHLRDHSLFIGYAPVKHPQVAITVILENEKGAPLIARKILDNYFLPKEKTTHELALHKKQSPAG